LGDFVRFGRGEEKSGGRRKHALLGDVFEAVTGAIFLDGGLEAAKNFVELALGKELRAADPIAAPRPIRKLLCRRNYRGLISLDRSTP